MIRISFHDLPKVRSLPSLVLILFFFLPGQCYSQENQDLLNPSQRQWLINHKAKLVLLEYHDNPPLEFRNDNGKCVGISNDYIHLIEEKLGFTFQRVRVEDIKQEDWMEFLASHVVTICFARLVPMSPAPRVRTLALLCSRLLTAVD